MISGKIARLKKGEAGAVATKRACCDKESKESNAKTSERTDLVEERNPD